MIVPEFSETALAGYSTRDILWQIVATVCFKPLVKNLARTFDPFENSYKVFVKLYNNYSAKLNETITHQTIGVLWKWQMHTWLRFLMHSRNCHIHWGRNASVSEQAWAGSICKGEINMNFVEI